MVELQGGISLSDTGLKDLLLRISKDIQDKKLFSDDTSVSAKFDDNSFFLITGFSNELTIDSVLLINYNTESTEDILPAIELHKNIYLRCSKVSAIIHSHGEYTSKLGMSNLPTIQPILDDMAQIIGPDLKILNDPYDINNITHYLNKRSALLINNYGGISVGRSIREAFVATQILEKSCHVYLQSKNIGGAKPVPPLAARIMHLVYKKRYSKKSL